jgi:squalene-associated FAD-dependent desaturase
VDRHEDQLARALTQRLLVIGGGWAGLAAAVRATAAGAQVTVLEMAPQLGGRARSWQDEAGAWRDSGQHILIGAYRDTLALMRTVGADPERLLKREPLTLVDPMGRGLRWPLQKHPVAAAMLAVAGHPLWGWRERWGLTRWGLRQIARGLRAPSGWSVARWCEGLPPAVRTQLIDPLCIAALNTPTDTASAAVLMRVLRDALLGGRGASDLLLPAAPLQELLPASAESWLRNRGAVVRVGARVKSLAHEGGLWRCDGHEAEAVILACSANEAARLTQSLAPDWSAQAAALPAEAIATVELHAPGACLAAPMVALSGGPAQFVFDLGQIEGGAGSRQGRFTAVASAVASELAQDGLETVAQRIHAQVAAQVPGLEKAQRTHAHADRRATFACTAQLKRPSGAVRPGLWAAGDYVDGPYPATLEGAVQAGLRAAEGAMTHNPRP